MTIVVQNIVLLGQKFFIFDINLREHNISYAQDVDLDGFIPYIEMLDDEEVLEIEVHPRNECYCINCICFLKVTM